MAYLVQLLLSVITFASSLVHATDFTALDNLISKSIFHQSKIDNITIDNIQIPYDPILVSVVASLKSRFPARLQHDWQTLTLPSSNFSPSNYCQGELNAYFRPSKANSPYTFIIITGSFATFNSGSFLNQITDNLDRMFVMPNIITFDGVYSPKFLKNHCFHNPWDLNAQAKNLYQRLYHFLLKIPGLDPAHTGLIGLSSGAYLALKIAAIDSAIWDRDHKGLARLGVMALSTPVHFRSAFAILDHRYQSSTIDQSWGLTTLDWPNVKFLLKNGQPQWQQMIPAFAKNPQEFIDRTYNEFTVVDLFDTIKAIGDHVETSSYYQYYITNGFQQEKHLEKGQANAAFDEHFNLESFIPRISIPTFIHLAKDDPILVSDGKKPCPQDGIIPAQITETMQRLANFDHIYVYHPPSGAHLGILLDPIFPELLEFFFQNSPPNQAWK